MKEMWKKIGKDIVLAVLMLSIFGYYQYFYPKTNSKVNEVKAASNEAQNVIDLSKEDIVLNPLNSGIVKYLSENENITVENLNAYEAEDENVSYKTYKIDTMINQKKETIFVTEMYLTDVRYLRGGFAGAAFGKSVREKPLDIMQRYDGMIAISGDNYGEADEGLVVRNGVWYQDKLNTNDLCILYLDGTMETVHATEFDEVSAKEKGVWQAWSFGPELLKEDGSVQDSFQTTDYVAATNPRSTIGYVEPGHYIWITVDGRQEGYSEGMDIQELAEFCHDLGCVQAYNLDGGKTATMMAQDYLISHPCEGMVDEGGRAMSDIIYLGNTKE